MREKAASVYWFLMKLVCAIRGHKDMVTHNHKSGHCKLKCMRCGRKSKITFPNDDVARKRANAHAAKHIAEARRKKAAEQKAKLEKLRKHNPKVSARLGP